MSTGPGSGVTILDASACWLLLRSAEVGRLAVAVADQPDIFPINFLVDQGTIVFRTAEGSKLAAMVTSPIVAFEADGYEPEVGEAWSVVIKGRATQIKQLHELVDTATFPSSRGRPGPSTASCGSCPMTSVAAGSTWWTQQRGVPHSWTRPAHRRSR